MSYFALAAVPPLCLSDTTPPAIRRRRAVAKGVESMWSRIETEWQALHAAVLAEWCGQPVPYLQKKSIQTGTQLSRTDAPAQRKPPPARTCPKELRLRLVFGKVKARWVRLF